MVKWVVETGLNEEYELELIKEISSRGYELSTVKYLPLNTHNFKKLSDSPNTIFIGSIPSSHKAHALTNWEGVFYHPDRYKWQNYYPFYKSFLLNNFHIMSTYSGIKSMFSHYTEFFESDKLFIRTNSSGKYFAAGVYAENELNGMPWFGSEICVVSKPRTIAQEWRFVVGSTGIISSSQYLPEWASGASAGATEFVELVLTKVPVYDKIWVIDVGICEGDYKVIEINAFSSSCLYECDLSKIVTTASKIVEEEVADIFSN